MDVVLLYTFSTDCKKWEVVVSRACGRPNFLKEAAMRALRIVGGLVAFVAAGWCQPAPQYPTGAYPKFIVSADLRHDGNIDVVTANYHDGTITVLLDNGNGTFQPEQNYPVGQWPTGLAVGDFNRDGILDLAVANAWYSEETGTPPPPPCPMCAADGVSILLGNGDGTFQTSVYYAAASGTAWVSAYDFNGDGKLDLVATAWAANQVSVLMGNGDGTFQAPVSYAVGTAPHSVAIADYNRDGKVDLAVGNIRSNNVTILLGNGDGTFRSEGIGGTLATDGLPHSIVTGDFNKDGKADLATADEAGDISVMLGNGDGTFQPAVNYASGSTTTAIVSADFDGDGIIDLAVSNAGATSTGGVSVAIFMGNGDGTFAAPVDYYTGGPGSVALVAGHFTNHNGYLDLAIAHFDSYVTVLYGNGTGSFSQNHPSSGKPTAGSSKD